MVTRRTFVKGVAATPLVGAALINAPGALVRAQAGGTVKVGSKNFPEELILGELYAQLLEAGGLKVERKLNLGGTAVAQAALVKGDIDLYPEYTGTGLIDILHATLADVPPATPAAGGTPGAANPAVDAVYQYVKREYQQKFNLVWLDQAPMNDSQALAVKKDFADKNHLTTISQLWSSGIAIKISAPSDFEDRNDGLKGLERVYGKANVKVIAVDPGIKYKSFLDGDANVVLAFSTDAEIGIYNLVVLVDDKHLWPPYHVAPVVRQQTLAATPQIATILNPLAPLLTTDVMVKLNGAVVGTEKKDPKDVAQAFLKQKGMVK